MSSRPEFQAPPGIYYNDLEAQKYTSSSLMVQTQLSERALELLGLPHHGLPRLLLIGCGSGLSGETLSENGQQWIGLDISSLMLNVALEREVEGDLLLCDMGQGLGLRDGVIDGAIVSLQFRAFFGSLYRCLARGAGAVFQLYPECLDQRSLICEYAVHAGFTGWLVVDYPHRHVLECVKRSQLFNLSMIVLFIDDFAHGQCPSFKTICTKRKKEYIVLSCGPRSTSTGLPKAEGENGESYSIDSQTVNVYERLHLKKRPKETQKKFGKAWVLKKKEQMLRRGVYCRT
ncbi:hypothetical protein GIB67_003580 [Kingdonia uniflora]|uniref:Uncharacterized protein n=1 Tax=Kingdonia uniflora TaxID=39325 RepID=A0A7J7MF18_9MAGN|nr:hypothetical protein GIB67_003580 [Kingdonia uniflora]